MINSNTHLQHEQMIDILESALGNININVIQVIAFRGEEGDCDKWGQFIVELSKQAANRRYANVHFYDSWETGGSHGGSTYSLVEYLGAKPDSSTVILGTEHPEVRWNTACFVPAIKTDKLGDADNCIADDLEENDESGSNWVIRSDFDRLVQDKKFVHGTYETLLRDKVINPTSVVQIAECWGNSDEDEAGFLIQLSRVPALLDQPGFAYIYRSSYFERTCCAPYCGSTTTIEYFSGKPKLASLYKGKMFAKYGLVFTAPLIET